MSTSMNSLFIFCVWVMLSSRVFFLNKLLLFRTVVMRKIQTSHFQPHLLNKLIIVEPRPQKLTVMTAVEVLVLFQTKSEHPVFSIENLNRKPNFRYITTYFTS